MQHRTTTKELIARSFLELSETKTIDRITVKDIVTNCAITKTTFYNHFCDKYDLMMWLYMTPVKNIISRINNTDHTFREALIANLNYFAANRNYLINALNNTLGHNSFLNRAFEINFTLLCDFVKVINKLDQLPMRIDTLIRLYVCGTVGLECDWLVNNMPIPVEEFAEILEAGLPEELKGYLYKTPKE